MEQGGVGVIYERARAKINLSLDVRHKRNDGYHELESIMQTVDLSDYITLFPRDEAGVSLTINTPFLPVDERNLAYKAAQVMRQVCGIKEGVHIDIDKRIPVAAGLAGGSSNAAAVLRGLNRLWQLDLPLSEISAIGARVGSDVPFCVYGGTALVRGRGEWVEPLPLQPAYWVLLAKPPVAVSTAEIYADLKLDEVTNHPRAHAMIAALQSGSLQQVAEAAGNVLETVTLQRFPEIDRIKDQFARLGMTVSLMSGSGPTVFGLTDKEQKAKKAFNSLRPAIKELFLCQTC